MAVASPIPIQSSNSMFFPFADDDIALFFPASAANEPLRTTCKASTGILPVPPIAKEQDQNTQAINDKELLSPKTDEGFKIAYHALADRRGINATPAGRADSRKVWRDAGADAAKWLIHKLQTEQHPDTIIGIAETITDLGTVALPVILMELEGCEPKPEYAALVEALSWMDPPQNFSLLLRINGIANRYLASSDRDCQIAAVQLTRILDDRRARLLLDKAQSTAGQRLREEIEDLLSERFEE